jgi:hypothetical protein
MVNRCIPPYPVERPQFRQVACGGPTCRYVPMFRPVFEHLSPNTLAEPWPYETVNFIKLEVGGEIPVDGWRIVRLWQQEDPEEVLWCPRCIEHYEATGKYICPECKRIDMTPTETGDTCTHCADREKRRHGKVSVRSYSPLWWDHTHS